MSRRKFQPVAKLAMLLLAVALPSSNSTRISFHTSSSIALQRHVQLGRISSRSSPHPRSRNINEDSYIFRVRGGAFEEDDDDDVDVDDEAETVITQTSTTQSSAAQDESDSDEDEHIENDDNKDDQSTTIDNSKPLHSALSNEPVPINVTTMLQCSVLDHSLEITAHRSRSVGFLKASLSKQLPGRPPVSMLQLKLGPKILSDELLVDELMDDDDDEDDDDEPEAASSSKLTLVLDMIPPIDVKSAIVSEAKLEELTPSQLLDAFAATEAAMYQNALLMAQEEQQQEVENVNADGEEENDEANSSRSTHSSTHMSPTLLVKERAARLRQDMETKLFQSASHQELLAETTPPAHKTLNLQEREVRGQRIRQVAQGGVKTTLRRKMQRNFNVSWADTIRTICLFLFFGYFGGRSPTSRAILLLGAPSVVFLQARPVKVWLRRLLYFALTHPPSIFLSLLPAPQQALLSVDVDHDMAVMYGEYIRDTVGGGEVKEQANSGDSDDYDVIANADQDESDDEYD